MNRKDFYVTRFNRSLRRAVNKAMRLLGMSPKIARQASGHFMNTCVYDGCIIEYYLTEECKGECVRFIVKTTNPRLK